MGPAPTSMVGLSLIGLAQAGIGAGGLVGAIAAPKLQERLPLWQLVIVRPSPPPACSQSPRERDPGDLCTL
jgi:hypothetical protein